MQSQAREPLSNLPCSFLSTTRFGRNEVIKQLGEVGCRCVEAMLSAAEKHADKATAKQLKNDMFRIIYKGAVLLQSNVISLNDILIARPPTLSMFEKLLDTLELDNSQTPLDMTELLQTIEASRGAIIPLCQTHMTVRDASLSIL